MLVERGFSGDNPVLHCFCATVASANAAVLGNPADVIKTRTMNTRSAGKAVGYFQLASQIYRSEGAFAFYNGLDALFMRLACWNCLMFMCLEQIKKLFWEDQSTPGKSD